MKAGSNEPPDKPSRPQPDPQGDGKASDDKPGTGDRPKSCGCTAGVLGADSNVGPICVVGSRSSSGKHHWPASVRFGILLSNFCCSEHDNIADSNSIRYVSHVKASIFLAIISFTTLLTGCSLEIHATKAGARVATSTDIQSDPVAVSARPEGAGMWVVLTAFIGRESVKRVARWEVYPHVYVVECSTGRETNLGTEPRLEGVPFSDFGKVSELLKNQPSRESIQMQSLIFARKGDFQKPQCLQFRGGSYTAQKIVEARIPISSDPKLNGS